MATTYCGNCGEQGVEHEDGFLYCRVCGVRLDGKPEAITTSAVLAALADLTQGQVENGVVIVPPGTIHATVTPPTVEASAQVHLPTSGE